MIYTVTSFLQVTKYTPYWHFVIHCNYSFVY